MAHANRTLTQAEAAELQQATVGMRELAKNARKMSANMRQLKWMAIGWVITQFTILCTLLFFAAWIIIQYYGIGN